MTKMWGDGCFEIRYFVNNEFPGLTAHRFSFDDFDFLENTMLSERLTKRKKLTVSEFKIIVKRKVVFIKFVKIRKTFRSEKIIITVSCDAGFCKEIKKSIVVKNQSRSELNEWVNGCLDDVELFNNTVFEIKSRLKDD